MEFPEKVMNQTWKNDKKTNFGPNFGSFWPNFGLKNFFSKVLFPLDVRNFCNPSLYVILRKTNLTNQTWENGKKNPSFGTVFDPFDPNLGSKYFCRGFRLDSMLHIVASYHCMEYQV